ncbi:DUF885 domain-containing protein [Amycolatopsis panacis]|uniref:DUF885 domain-containing protein n=1 Tax=Amycolatopsis panacis TaxID=2340917 RepID=A0A419HV49_9PSEU|nr:DUF885 domain-containing protein [Amycolatopsis panacis]RJQ80824.1 DUF885 domain-containing protein [Amycolatopsis panacis]
MQQTNHKSPIREIADELVHRLLTADPFGASTLGVREYDRLAPAASAQAAVDLDADLAVLADRATGLSGAESADRVTLGVVRSACERERASIANADAECTATATPFAGPPTLLAVAARTTLPDTQAADDYLARLSGAAAWIDAKTDRLRDGRAKGRLPVAELVDHAVGWADRVLAEGVPTAFATPVPPQGWAGASGWRTQVEDTVKDAIMPALARWRDLLTELRPIARSAERPGRCALPGGEADYTRDIAMHTTLPLTAQQLHRTGLETIEELEARARELGSPLGLNDRDAIVAALRASVSERTAEQAIVAAREAIARAEAIAPRLMPGPLPPPCGVEPMPETVGASGMAPHYVRPQRGRGVAGGRPGTYWFNTMRPTAGAGWDLEAIAFHEAVPGHHSQHARAQLIEGLPLLQQMSITVHSEGWALYAEELAGEFGLYSDARAELGAVSMAMHRTARMVIDTGLHAFGWSRARAIEFMLTRVGLPEGFLVNEVDRCLTIPGQALAYLTGKREIVRLRAAAQRRLGAEFDLRKFHAAVLGSGSVPMPVLEEIVTEATTKP